MTPLLHKGGESRSADGVLQIDTGKTIEKKAQASENVISKMKNFRQANPLYNGEKNNCADYGAVGVGASGVKIGNKDKVTALGGMLSSDVRTPNKLWRDTASQPGVTVLKEPGARVNEKYDF